MDHRRHRIAVEELEVVHHLHQIAVEDPGVVRLHHKSKAMVPSRVEVRAVHHNPDNL